MGRKENRQPIVKEIIKSKRKTDFKLFTMLTIIVSLLFIYFGIIDKDIIPFIIGGFWLFTICYSYIKTRPNGTIVLTNDEIKVIEEKERIYKWKNIEYLQFEENFTFHGRVGLTLRVRYFHEFHPIWFTDYDIKEEEFKKLTEKISGKKLFKENYVRVS